MSLEMSFFKNRSVLLSCCSPPYFLVAHGTTIHGTKSSLLSRSNGERLIAQHASAFVVFSTEIAGCVATPWVSARLHGHRVDAYDMRRLSFSTRESTHRMLLMTASSQPR